MLYSFWVESRLFGTLPEASAVTNGSQLVSKALDRWAYEKRVAMDSSGPGKPTDNAFAESFIGSLRDEWLKANWFLFGGRPGQDRRMAGASQ
jgi:transposase InsO family protein